MFFAILEKNLHASILYFSIFHYELYMYLTFNGHERATATSAVKTKN